MHRLLMNWVLRQKMQWNRLEWRLQQILMQSHRKFFLHLEEVNQIIGQLKVLQEEIIKFTEEREAFAKKKAFYERVKQFEAHNYQQAEEKPQIVRGEMFFIGVGNQQTLKKRYKDLVKICKFLSAYLNTKNGFYTVSPLQIYSMKSVFPNIF